MADVFLSVRSNKPGASEIVLINGQLTTGYRYIDSDLGNVTWDKVYSGMRGTQGARLVGATAQNRLSTWTLEVVGASKDEMNSRLSVLHGLDEELRRFGGTATWRQQGSSFRQHLDVLDSGLSYVAFDWLEHHENRIKVTLGLVTPPYFEYDPFDIFELWASDSVGAGDYTFDAGAAAEVSVVGGQLTAVSNLGNEKRLIHTGRGFTYGNTQATLKYVPGATIASFKAGVVLKRIDALNYIEVYVDDNGTNTRLRIDKVVAGARTNLYSSNSASRISNGTPAWVRGRLEGNTVYAETFASAPTPMATPRAESGSYILTTGEAATFGYTVQGRAGLAWIPQHASALLDDSSVEPFTYRNVTGPVDRHLPGAIPGDAPALVEAVITPSGGAAAPIWALIGVTERVPTFNYVWDGDFESASLNAAHWSVAAVTNMNAAATSITRITTAAKYGTCSGQIVCPATLAAGANFRIFRRFTKGVTYTVELWIHAASATTAVQCRLGNAAANDIVISGNTNLSTTWQRITATWTPTADRDDAHIGVMIAAATATTFEIDGVMVYEGTAAPTSLNQSEGRGGFPPFGIIEAENDNSWGIINSGATYRSGFALGADVGGVLADQIVIDPSLLTADDYTQNEVSVECWARVEVNAVTGGILTLSARPLSTTLGLPVIYADEHGSIGKPAPRSSAGTVFRFVRCGTLRLPTDRGRYGLSLRFTPGAPAVSIDYLLLVPARFRACSPSGKANDSNYPVFVSATTELTRRIHSDLSGTLVELPAGTPEIDAPGLGGALLEAPPGDLDAVVKLSSLVPDDPTSNTSTEQLAHSATVHFAVTPRGRLGRSS